MRTCAAVQQASHCCRTGAETSIRPVEPGRGRRGNYILFTCIHPLIHHFCLPLSHCTFFPFLSPPNTGLGTSFHSDDAPRQIENEGLKLLLNIASRLSPSKPQCFSFKYSDKHSLSKAAGDYGCAIERFSKCRESPRLTSALVSTLTTTILAPTIHLLVTLSQRPQVSTAIDQLSLSVL